MADIFGSILKGKHDSFGDAIKAGWAGSRRGREEERDRASRALIDARLASEGARKAYWERQGGQSGSSGPSQYILDAVLKYRDQLASRRNELFALGGTDESGDIAGMDEAVETIDKWLNINLGLTPQPSSAHTLPGFMGVPMPPTTPKPDDFNTEAVKSWTKWMPPPAANKGTSAPPATPGGKGLPPLDPYAQNVVPGTASSLSQTQVVTIKNDAEYDKLPSGTVFIGPDGKKRKKP